MSLKINFFTNYRRSHGTFFRFHNLAKGLKALGHEVKIFSANDTKAQRRNINTIEGVEYYSFKIDPGQRYFTSSSNPLTCFKRCLFNYPKCDIVHLFQPCPNAALSWLLLNKNKAELFFYDWDDLWADGLLNRPSNDFSFQWNKLFLRIFEKTLPQKADYVTTCGSFLNNLSRERNAKKSSIIYNGYWPSKLPDKEECRKKLGLKLEANYVGFMGNTTSELSWCLKGLENNMEKYSNLRMAACGFSKNILSHCSKELLSKIDYLGELSPEDAKIFSKAIDLGLLPLEDNLFNRSRFPVKFSEYLAGQTSVLCSEVGECADLSRRLPFVLKAGKTLNSWLQSFSDACRMLEKGRLPIVDLNVIEDILSWGNISKKLSLIYQTELENKLKIL